MSETLVHTALTPEQCCDRLSDAFDHDGPASFFGAFGSNRVMGRVSETGFRLQIRIFYGSSFKTFLWGTFLPAPSGTSVQLRAGMHPFVFAFLTLWLALTLPDSMGAAGRAFTTLNTKGLSAALPVFADAFVPTLFVVALFWVGRWLARDEEAELARFVIDRLKPD